MNFELILIVAALISFFFWLIHKYIVSNKLIDFVQSFFGVLLLVLVIRSFMFEPFRIPSSSMRPTLVIGDFVLVNKFTYGIRLPVLRTKIFDINHPKKGDIVVFKYPLDESVDYIKRVIGVPGDKIEIAGDELFINNELVETKFIGKKKWDDQYCRNYTSDVFQEKLPEKSHLIMSTSKLREAQKLQRGFNNGDDEQIIPEGQYFMMGDNRHNSTDSRFWNRDNTWGFVPEKNIVGKAQVIWMNVDWSGDCAKGIQLNRIGNIDK